MPDSLERTSSISATESKVNSVVHSPPLSLSAWLRSARGPYLNFLRNLTPQVLLASMAWVLASRLDFTRPDLRNFGPTFMFFAFLLLFGFAVYSNISLFLAELFPSFMPWVSQREDVLRSAKIAKGRVPFQLFSDTLKERRLEVFLAVFALVMLQMIFAGVLASSITSAVTFIRSIRT